MKIKSFVVALVIIVTCVSVTGCYPDSRRMVENVLDSVITIKYKYKSVSRGQTRHGYDENTYYFEDKNGIDFYVSSGYVMQGVGSILGSPIKDNRCNYVAKLWEVRKETADKAIESDLPTVFKSGYYYELEVFTYGDLEQAAVVVEKALNAVPPFTVNRDEYEHYYKYGSSDLPYIKVRHYSSWHLGFGEFYFLCDGEIPLTKSEILDQLQRTYTDRVKRGDFDEILPDAAL